MTTLDPKTDKTYLADIDSSGGEKAGVLRHINSLGRRDKIVEIGPGGGAALKIIMARVAELDEESRPLVSILDISSEVLRRIEGLLADAGIDTEYETKEGDISKKLPYEDSSVQAVNLSSVLHECFSYGGGEEGMQIFIKELNRVLATSGVVAYRDMNGVDLKKPASFRLKTELSEKFLEIFFAKYFDKTHTKYKKPNYHYLDNLSIGDDSDGRRNVTCDAGLAHEFKRHLIIFTTTFLPDTMYSLETLPSGIQKISFAKDKGKKKFIAFLEENNLEYKSSDEGIEVSEETIGTFQEQLDKEISGLFSNCEILLENENDIEILSQFFNDNDITHSRNDKQITVGLQNLVLVYSKFKRVVYGKNIKVALKNKKQEKLLEWFEREGEESYFYGDQIDMITKFLEYSMTEDEESSMLGHTCLVPIGLDDIQITQRQSYTSYVLGQVEDIEGSYQDGKNTITFVKRPIEYVIPTLLALYKQTGDIRILTSLKKIIHMIETTLPSPGAEKALEARVAQDVQDARQDEAIYGLIGGIASGKSTAADAFKECGFEVVELSAFIKARIEAAGIEFPTRDHYFEMGNAMRRENGNDVLSGLCIEKIEREGAKKVVISGIRTPEDIARFRQRFPSFKAVAVDTPLEVRIKRIKDRMRDIDPTDRDKMIADIDREWNDVVDEGCKLKATIATADIRIDGSQSIETMKQQCIALASQNR